MAAAFGFSAVAARVGGSYFARLAAGDVALAAAAARAPAFAALVASYAPSSPAPGGARTRAAACAFSRAGSAPPASGLGALLAPAPTAPPPRASRFGFAPPHATPSRADAGRLAGLYLACVHVAAKNVERVPYARLLPAMLAWARGGAPVPAAEAAVLELDVLTALEWRLGPFFGDGGP